MAYHNNGFGDTEKQYAQCKYVLLLKYSIDPRAPPGGVHPMDVKEPQAPDQIYRKYGELKRTANRSEPRFECLEPVG
jgi:hypothetical protein